MQLHGIEFDFTPLRVSDAERFDAATAALREKAAHPPQARSLTEAVRFQCAAFDDFFAGTLGEDYADKTGIDTENLESLSALFAEMMQQSNKAKDAAKAALAPAQQHPPAPVRFEPHGNGRHRRR